jgi:hypothetical protein
MWKEWNEELFEVLEKHLPKESKTTTVIVKKAAYVPK